ncbi:MAG: hypothetical protein LC114_07980 [Bryobacterales bacterium]|nr:hypothetical protein [Bryobacterales bacterium]
MKFADCTGAATLHRAGVRGASWLGRLLLASLLLLVLWTPLARSQGPATQAILVVPFMQGTPITVNGVAYQETTTIFVNPDAVLSISGPWVYDRADGYRFRLQSIVIQRGVPGNSYEEQYATNTLDLPNAHDIYTIRLNTSVEPRVLVNVSGPGTVVWDPPEPPEGFVPLGTSITLTPTPNANAYFSGWEEPWSEYDGPILLHLVTTPKTLTAIFREKTSPPATLTTDAPFPELRLRTSDYRLEGQVTVLSSSPLRIREIQTSCDPPSMVLRTFFSSVNTPFVFQASLGPEHNLVADGTYHCTTVMTRYDGEPPLVIPIEVQIGDKTPETPPLVSVNGASFEKMSLAPGSIFSLFGESLGQTTAYAESLPLPRSLGGIRVRIRSGGADYEAPLFYVSAKQINILVPPTLPLGDGTLEVLRTDEESISTPVRVEWQAPGLFSANSRGSGPPAGYYMRVRGSEQVRGEFVNCPEGRECTLIPIESTDPTEEIFLVLFGTGFRNTPYVKPQVHMGGMVVEADYFGAHRDFAGLDQINVKVPRALLGKGALPVFVTHGAKTSNTLTVQF